MDIIKYEKIEGSYLSFKSGLSAEVNNPFSTMVLPYTIPFSVWHTEDSDLIEEHLNDTVRTLSGTIGFNSVLGWTHSPRKWLVRGRPSIIYKFKDNKVGRFLSYYLIPQNGLKVERFVEVDIVGKHDVFSINTYVNNIDDVYKRCLLDSFDKDIATENRDVMFIFIINNNNITNIKDNMAKRGFDFNDCFGIG